MKRLGSGAEVGARRVEQLLPTVTCEMSRGDLDGHPIALRTDYTPPTTTLCYSHTLLWILHDPHNSPFPSALPLPPPKPNMFLTIPKAAPSTPKEQQVSPPLPPRTTLHLGLRTLRWILLPFLLDLGGARAALVLRHAVEDLGDVLAAAPPGRLLCTPEMRLAGSERIGEIDGVNGVRKKEWRGW